MLVFNQKKSYLPPAIIMVEIDCEGLMDALVTAPGQGSEGEEWAPEHRAVSIWDDSEWEDSFSPQN